MLYNFMDRWFLLNKEAERPSEEWENISGN